MEINVKVLGVKRVDFKNKDDKEIRGTQVFYTPIDNSDENVIGHHVLTEWFEGLEKFDDFKKENVPGNYKMIHSVQLRGSKPAVKIEDFILSD